jgi:molybdopterin-guanine dinucleotide biosynthesis protein A
MNEKIEAVLLTGGASRRMGQDKAKLLVEGEHLAARILRLLREAGITVTTCGREPVGTEPFLKDTEEFAGPLAALAEFQPQTDLVFVCSCDLPGFDASIVTRLCEELGDGDAVVPQTDGRLQPLCALYRASAFQVVRELHGAGEKRIMSWLGRLEYRIASDLPVAWIRNVNYANEL